LLRHWKVLYPHAYQSERPPWVQLDLQQLIGYQEYAFGVINGRLKTPLTGERGEV
jgi:hypothetical protein